MRNWPALSTLTRRSVRWTLDTQPLKLTNAFQQGSLDIMVQRRGGSGVNRHVQFVKNNIFHDAFFLKALGMQHPF